MASESIFTGVLGCAPVTSPIEYTCPYHFERLGLRWEKRLIPWREWHLALTMLILPCYNGEKFSVLHAASQGWTQDCRLVICSVQWSQGLKGDRVYQGSFYCKKEKGFLSDWHVVSTHPIHNKAMLCILVIFCFVNLVSETSADKPYHLQSPHFTRQGIYL